MPYIIRNGRLSDDVAGMTSSTGIHVTSVNTNDNICINVGESIYQYHITLLVLQYYHYKYLRYLPICFKVLFKTFLSLKGSMETFIMGRDNFHLSQNASVAAQESGKNFIIILRFV